MTPENQSQQGVFQFFFPLPLRARYRKSSVTEVGRAGCVCVCVSGQTGASASLQPGCENQAVCHLCVCHFLCVLCARVSGFICACVSLHLKACVCGVGETREEACRISTAVPVSEHSTCRTKKRIKWFTKT